MGICGKKEGFQSLAMAIEEFSIDNTNYCTLPNNNDEDVLESTDNWTPERERKMSYECFDFPDSNPDIMKLEQRDLPGIASPNRTESISSSYSESMWSNTSSEWNEVQHTEDLLTQFDVMVHFNESEKTWADIPCVVKKMCPIPAVTFKQDKKLVERKSTVTIGKYTAMERQRRIEIYLEKRKRRRWGKSIKYSCRKKLADDRPRVKGRFVKRDE